VRLERRRGTGVPCRVDGVGRSLLLTAAGCSVAMVPPARASAQGPAPRATLTESLDLHVPVAPTPVRIDGRIHLVYELHLTNPRADTVVLTRIRVVGDADTTRPLADLAGNELARRVQPFGRTRSPIPATTLPPGVRRIHHAWVALPAGAIAPRALRHYVDASEGASPGGAEIQLRGAPVTVARATPAVLHAPLRGGDWAALYDPLLFGGHRMAIYTIDGRARIPGRFAIDLVRLPPTGTFDPHARGLERNGFGAEVLAVADGVITAAVDDMPDNDDTPGAPRRRFPMEQASGNYVALALADGRVAFYEHLKAGSLRVRRGTHVRAGDVLAQLGYSGSSSIGPHLHFHVSDGNSLLGAEGVPFVFRTYRELGAFAGIEAFVAGAPWLPRAGRGERPGVGRREEMPAPNSVIDFGTAVGRDGAGAPRR